MELKEVFAKRRSVRSYTGEPATEEQLATVLAAAQAAPVGMGLYDNYCLTVVTDKALLNEFVEAGRKLFNQPDRDILYGAPTLIVVSARVAPAQANAIHSSAAMIVHNMALQATELGLGSCDIWGCIAAVEQDPALTAKLNLPEGFTPCSGLVLGVTDVSFDVREIPANRIKVNAI